MGLNRLYFDDRASLIKAGHAASPALRQDHQTDGLLIAGPIVQNQAVLGAAAPCAWIARECE